MADVLDQTEVDALLAAVDAGQVGEGDEDSFGPGKQKLQRDVRTYDFKRPERVSKDQMRALEAIHEGFARNFGAALSAFLRTIIEVRVTTTEQLTYSEFIYSLPNPTVFNLMSVAPLEGKVCLELSPLIIYPIIDRLLGGNSTEMYIPQRPLTSIEMRLISRILDRALSNLTELWSNLVDVEFKLTETESNPHLVQIVAPNEVVVVVGFELKMGVRAGTMSLCIPFNVIEPVMDKLATQSWLLYHQKAVSERQVEALVTNVQSTKVDLRSYLGETTIRLGELMALQPGDIIETDRPANSEVVLEIEGRGKFAARLGQYNGTRAVKITRPIEHGQRI